MRRVVTVVLWAAAIVLMSETASAQEFCIQTSLQGGGSRNFRASIMSVVGSSASITVVNTASVNAIGFGALNFNFAFLAPITLAWTVISNGTAEHYDCRLFYPSYSGVGNLLTVNNSGNTRVQLSPCAIVTC